VDSLASLGSVVGRVTSVSSMQALSKPKQENLSGFNFISKSAPKAVELNYKPSVMLDRGFVGIEPL
jgi:hypothetical protein